MAVAEDATTPAASRSAAGTTGTTLASASFSPPAGSVVVVLANVILRNVFTGTPSISLSNSGGLSFTQLVNADELNTKFAYNGLWIAQVGGAPGAMTVTMTRSEASAGGLQLVPRVVTGGSGTAGATVGVDHAASGTAGEAPITPTAVGSLIYWATNADNSPLTSTAASGNTLLDDWDDTTDVMHATVGRLTGLTSSLSSVTLGTAWGASSNSYFEAVEIVPGAPGRPATTVVNRVPRIRSSLF